MKLMITLCFVFAVTVRLVLAAPPAKKPNKPTSASPAVLPSQKPGAKPKPTPPPAATQKTEPFSEPDYAKIRSIECNAEGYKELAATNPTPEAALEFIKKNSFSNNACYFKVLEWGVSPNAIMAWESPLLKEIVFRGDPELLKLAIKKGANLKYKDPWGHTLLAISARNGRIEAYKILVANGLNPIDDASRFDVALSAAESPTDYFLKDLAKRSPDIFTLKVGYNNETLLPVAVRSGRFESVKYLLSQKADPNVTDNSGNPLWVSLWNPSAEIVQALLDAGMDPKVKSKSGLSIVTHLARSKGLNHLIADLIDKGADPAAFDVKDGNNALHGAASRGDLELVEYLESIGMSLKTEDAAGNNLLYYAVNGGNLELVKFLVGKGINPKARLKDGSTLLFNAVYQPAIFDYLLSLGLDPKASDQDGNTLLHSFAKTGYDAKLCEKLSTLGVDPNLQNNDGVTPLQLSVAGYSDEVFKCIIEKTKAVDVANKSGVTALQIAVRRGKLLYVEMLDKKGASFNQKSPEGATLVQLAAASRDSDTFNYLVDVKKAKLDGKDSTGQDILHYAAASPVIFNKVIKSGFVDVNEEDNSGNTPFTLALSFGNADVITAMLDQKAKFKKRSKPESPATWELARNIQDKTLLKRLIAAGLDVNEVSQYGTPWIVEAASRGDIDTVEFLISQKADLNAKDKYGTAALDSVLWGSSSNKAIIVQALLNAGYKLDRSEDGLFTIDSKKSYWESKTDDVLVTAINGGLEPEIVKLFIDKPERLKGKTRLGGSIMLNAISGGNLNTVKFLEAQGIPLTLKDQANKDNGLSTTLHYLAQTKSPEVFDYVLSKLSKDPEFKKYLETEDGSQYTPLAVASERHYPRYAKALIDAGANINIKIGYYKASLLHSLAAGAGLDDSESQANFKLLISKGLSINEKDSDGNTPLHYAFRGSVWKPNGTLKFLVDNGADLNAVNDKGQTPLHLVAQFGTIEDLNLIMKQKGVDLYAADNEGLSVVNYLSRSDNIEKKKLITSLTKSKRKLLWDDWVKKGKLPKNEKDPEQALIESLILALRESNAMPVAPFANAPENIKEIYKNVKIARTAPWDLTAKALDVEGVPSYYFREIAKGAQKPEALYSHKFKPTPEQAKNALEAILSDSDADDDDYKTAAWLAVKGNLELTLKLLGLFKFDEKKLKADVNEMLKTGALEYKGTPSLAVIKMAKALLAYPESAWGCGNDFDTTSSILNWITVYGDGQSGEGGQAPDRTFISKVLAYILRNRPVCPQDRTLALSAMRSWSKSHPAIQYEVACVIAESIGLKPEAERTVDDFVLVSRAIGLQSNLNETQWYEQLGAFGDLRLEKEPDQGLALAEQDLSFGLLQYTLGGPVGSVKVKGATKAVQIQPAFPHKLSIVKMCQIMDNYEARSKKQPLSSDEENRMRGARHWIYSLKHAMLAPRVWPAGFTPETPLPSPAPTLGEEFVNNGMTQDLHSVCSACGREKEDACLPSSVQALKPKQVNAAKGTTPPAKLKSNGDFDPFKGTKKKLK